MKEEDIDTFAIKLAITLATPVSLRYTDVKRRYIELLKETNCENIDLSSLVNHNERVTFIRGTAGIGKSVLSKRLAYSWACDSLYTKFRLCIVVECRDVNDFAANEGKRCKKRELFSEYLKSRFSYDFTNDLEALVIIIGIDELFDINKADSIIWQLLDTRNPKYTMAKIILTGRPHVEQRLKRIDKDLGGLRRLEILELNEDQIIDYISKFTTCKKDVGSIVDARKSLTQHLPVIQIPHFLNLFCCVVLLTEEFKANNAAKLYCWTLYLLLEQYVEEQVPSEERISKVLRQYSGELLALCNICHELLESNELIFEKKIQPKFWETGKGKKVLDKLFIRVSWYHTVKYQFMHVTLLEFLSAVHICRMGNRIEILKRNLNNGFDQVVVLSCQLISGYVDGGIIKDMFTDDKELDGLNLEQFVGDILKLVIQNQNTKKNAGESGCDNSNDGGSKVFVDDNDGDGSNDDYCSGGDSVNGRYCGGNDDQCDGDNNDRITDYGDNGNEGDVDCNDDDDDDDDGNDNDDENDDDDNDDDDDDDDDDCDGNGAGGGGCDGNGGDANNDGGDSNDGGDGGNGSDKDDGDDGDAVDGDDGDDEDGDDGDDEDGDDGNDGNDDDNDNSEDDNDDSEDDEDHEQKSLQLSIDILSCFINKKVVSKQFIISTFKTLPLGMTSLGMDSMRKISKICQHVIQEYKCNQEELKNAFENSLVEVVEIDDVNSMAASKYLPTLNRMELWKLSLATDKLKSEVSENKKCTELEVLFCKLDDERILKFKIGASELKWLGIVKCNLKKYSFINICNWVKWSSVEEFRLQDIDNIENSWWQQLTDIFASADRKSDGTLALKKLYICNCTQKMDNTAITKVGMLYTR